MPVTFTTSELDALERKSGRATFSTAELDAMENTHAYTPSDSEGAMSKDDARHFLEQYYKVPVYQRVIPGSQPADTQPAEISTMSVAPGGTSVRGGTVRPTSPSASDLDIAQASQNLANKLGAPGQIIAGLLDEVGPEQIQNLPANLKQYFSDWVGGVMRGPEGEQILQAGETPRERPYSDAEINAERVSYGPAIPRAEGQGFLGDSLRGVGRGAGTMIKAAPLIMLAPESIPHFIRAATAFEVLNATEGGPPGSGVTSAATFELGAAAGAPMGWAGRVAGGGGAGAYMAAEQGASPMEVAKEGTIGALLSIGPINKEKPNRTDAKDTWGLPRTSEAQRVAINDALKEAEAAKSGQRASMDEGQPPQPPISSEADIAAEGKARIEAALNQEQPNAADLREPQGQVPQGRVADEVGKNQGGENLQQLPEGPAQSPKAQQQAQGEVAGSPRGEQPGAGETGGTAGTETAPGERPPNATSLRRAWMDDDTYAILRDEMKVLPDARRKSQQEMLDNAKAKGIPERALDIASEIENNPRALSDEETAGFAIRAAEIKNAHQKAMDRVQSASDPADITGLSAEINRLEGEWELLYKAGRHSGTEKGRALWSQKLTIDDNYNILSVKARAKAAKGADLTPEESSSLETTVRKLNEENAKLKSDLAAAEARKPAPDPDWLTKLTDRANEARKRMASKLSTMRAGIDPEMLVDLSVIGAEKIARGVKSAVDFAKEMKKEFGKDWKKLKGYAEDIYKASMDAYSQSRRATKEQADEMRRRRAELQQDKQAAATEGIRRGAERGSELRGMGRQINQLAEEFVRQGVTDREPLIDAVHDVVTAHFPEATRRETMDAISGYGDFSPLNKDPVKAKLRDLKGQMQQVGKLEDMKAGQAPAKTGVERRTPSDEERDLIKQVNEAKKRGGYAVTDPERQLKTSLQAAKTRVANQISDLEKQIETRQKIVKEKSPQPSDPELEQLKARRDELRKQYDEIFGKTELTDEQRVDLAIKAAEKSIAENQRRIAERDLLPQKKGRRTPENERLRALRAEQKALSREIRKLREAAGVFDSARIERRMENAQREIDTLDKHISEGTLIEPKPQKRRPTNQQLEERLAQLKERRRKYSGSDQVTIDRLDKRIEKARNRLENIDQETLPGKDKRTDKQLNSEIEQRQFTLYKLQRDIRRQIDSKRPKTIFDKGGDYLNLARAIQTGYDVSAPGRQGWWFVLTNPIMASKNVVTMLKSFASERVAWRVMDEIEKRPNAPLYWRNKLALTSTDGPISSREEAFMTRLIGKIPIIKHLPLLKHGVEASERAYVTFLNKTRADVFDSLLRTLAKNGEATPYEQRVIADYVNTGTGRASLGKFESSAVALNTLFFSPRYLASRFKLLSGQPMYRGTARTRILIARDYAKVMVGIGTLMAIGVAAGGELQPDGQLKIGNQYIDFTAGLSKVIRLVRMIASGKKTTNDGKEVDLRGEKKSYGKSVSDEIWRFARGKMAPVPAAILNSLDEQNVVGDYTNAGLEAVRLVTPISARDVMEGFQYNDIPQAVGTGLLSLFGVGVQTRDPNKRSRPKAGTRKSAGVYLLK